MAGSTRLTALGAVSPLAKISSAAEFEALIESVLLIADDAERLVAIREKLGMGIPDDLYREAAAAYGFQIDPESCYGN